MTRPSGMTLIELLVAMTIGLGVTLAVTSLLIVGENHRRTTTSTNDAEQSGAYAFYALDRALRSAGSAIAESAYPSDRGVLTCRLNAKGLLPRPAAFPSPFTNRFLSGATNTLRVAPLLIAQGQSDDNKSDVLVVMSGSGAAGGVPRQVTGSGNATSLVLDNTVGFQLNGVLANDVALVSQSGTTDCLLEQISNVTPTTLTLNPVFPYYTLGTTTTIGTLATSTSTYVTPLGNAAANNISFLLFGVDANRTLYSYDLLQNLRLVNGTGLDTSQAIADGVDQMHAIYGIDSTGGLVQNTWVPPNVASGYDINSVMTTEQKIFNILAVRVALVLRGEYYDKNPVSPQTLTLFGGLTDTSGAALPGVVQTVSLNLTDQHYRYRVFEFTIPLRNMLLMAAVGK